MKPRYDVVAPERNSADFPIMQRDRRAAIRQFMDRKGLKPSPWAKSAHLRESTLRDYLSGRNATLTLETLDRLADAADATVAEMIGERTPDPRKSRDVVGVQGIRVSAAMGGGVEVSEEPAGEPFYFRRTWLEEKLGGEVAMLRVISLKGDSMEPTLSDGDIALIKIGEGDLVNEPGIYCLWDGSGLMVKRLQLLPGSPPTLRILSDNRELYPPYDVRIDDVRVIGRIIWRAGAL